MKVRTHLSKFIYEILKNVSQDSMDAIYDSDRLDFDFDHSFIIYE